MSYDKTTGKSTCDECKQEVMVGYDTDRIGGFTCGDCIEGRTPLRLRAEKAEALAASMREEFMWIVSYLAHNDQDANHAWMVRRIRAVIDGKSPSEVQGWTEYDGVRKRAPS